MKTRIRQIDIAKELGLERSTISKALKGDPAISPKTRVRVKEAADRLGFRPDPMLSALAQYRKRAPAPYRSSIAWVYNYANSTDMSIYAGHADYFNGAKERCRELGYHLEPFWVDGKRISLKQLPNILKARGIRAVIFGPQAEVGVKLSFPLETFSALTIGYSLIEPKMDVITNDHFTTMTDILERLREKGYKRIGCYLWENDNERMGRRARSAFSAFSNEISCNVRLYQTFDTSKFQEWINKNRLDAVVCRGNNEAKVVELLNQERKRTIRCVGYAIDIDQKQISGMSHNNFQIGVRAAEWISSKLERGQFGEPKITQRLLIAGEWVEN